MRNLDIWKDNAFDSRYFVRWWYEPISRTSVYFSSYDYHVDFTIYQALQEIYTFYSININIYSYYSELQTRRLAGFNLDVILNSDGNER